MFFRVCRCALHAEGCPSFADINCITVFDSVFDFLRLGRAQNSEYCQPCSNLRRFSLWQLFFCQQLVGPFVMFLMACTGWTSFQHKSCRCWMLLLHCLETSMTESLRRFPPRGIFFFSVWQLLFYLLQWFLWHAQVGPAES